MTKYLLFVLALAGCDHQVSFISDSTQSVLEETTQSCTYAGHCCGTGLGFDGKYEFSCGFKFNCSGREPIRRRVQTGAWVWASGKKTEGTLIMSVDILGACQ